MVKHITLGMGLLVMGLVARVEGQGNTCAKSPAPVGSPVGAVTCTCTCAQGPGKSASKSVICPTGKCGPCDCGAPMIPKAVCG